MTNRSVVVTGAHSYLGQKLLEHLSAVGGFDVTALITPWADEDGLIKGDHITYFKADLQEALPEKEAARVRTADRVLHFAWIRGKDEDKILDENRRMFENLKEHISSPDNLVFISSVAASPDTLSTYGKTKFKMAQELSKYGAIILVTGLIVDKEPKGPYKLLVSVVKKIPFSFRFTKNSVKVYPIRTDDFLNAIVAILSAPVSSGSYRLYPSNAADINDFLDRLEKKYLRTRVPLPISYKLALGLLRSTHRLGILPATLGEKLLTFLYKDEAYLATHATLPGSENIDRPFDELI